MWFGAEARIAVLNQIVPGPVNLGTVCTDRLIPSASEQHGPRPLFSESNQAFISGVDFVN
jgi:hypothetical protein